jgi:hypothetical protein
MRTQIAVAEGQRHQLGARAGAELALSVSHMSSHGLVRDVQILRDLAPGLPQRDLFDDLQLAFGESDGALGRRRARYRRRLRLVLRATSAIQSASVISRPPSTKS